MGGAPGLHTAGIVFVLSESESDSPAEEQNRNTEGLGPIKRRLNQRGTSAHLIMMYDAGRPETGDGRQKAVSDSKESRTNNLLANGRGIDGIDTVVDRTHALCMRVPTASQSVRIGSFTALAPVPCSGMEFKVKVKFSTCSVTGRGLWFLTF
jgi:hypothetical protein